MDRLRVGLYVFENFGVLRHVARYVRSETACKEVDFYDRLQPTRSPTAAVADHRDRRSAMLEATWRRRRAGACSSTRSGAT